MSHVKKLIVKYHSTVVGTIVDTGRSGIAFQYSGDWIKTGFNLSPFKLKFDASVQPSKDIAMFGGLHGVFNDSLPDGWGLMLMDRKLKEVQGWDPREISPLDRLAYIGQRAMGALEYQPEHWLTETNEALSLTNMANASILLVEDSTEKVINQLLIYGGSPGGARPKVTVALSADGLQCISGFKDIPDDFTHWIVKFHAKEDGVYSGLLEKTYADMAREAGIDMPPSKIIAVKTSLGVMNYFAVERFDRERNKKKHCISLGGLIEASHRLPSVDYDTILAAANILTKDVKEVEKLFRLMVFNVATHNKDDHVKNFSFIGDIDGWKVSPAFDLTFSAGMNNEHTSSINGSGNPSLSDIKNIAEKHSIKNWQEIVEDVLLAVSQFSHIAENYGVPLKEIDAHKRAFPLIK